MSDLKLSIVTAVYNNESYISDCLKSVSNQEYPNFEHIIIDGAINDGTVDIIRNHENDKYFKLWIYYKNKKIWLGSITINLVLLIKIFKLKGKLFLC